MKFCKDCKFFEGDNTCNHVKTKSVDLVSGKMISESWRDSACLQRQDDFFESLMMETCGKRGRWWKPKDENV